MTNADKVITGEVSHRLANLSTLEMMTHTQGQILHLGADKAEEIEVAKTDKMGIREVQEDVVEEMVAEVVTGTTTRGRRSTMIMLTHLRTLLTKIMMMVAIMNKISLLLDKAVTVAEVAVAMAVVIEAIEEAAEEVAVVVAGRSSTNSIIKRNSQIKNKHSEILIHI